MPKHGLGQGIRVSQTVLSPQARFGTRIQCPRPCPGMVWDKAIACPELTVPDQARFGTVPACPELCSVPRHSLGHAPCVPNHAQAWFGTRHGLGHNKGPISGTTAVTLAVLAASVAGICQSRLISNRHGKTGPDFYDELKYFKRIKNDVSNFCMRTSKEENEYVHMPEEKYEALFHHFVYNKTWLLSKFPPETQYISIVRKPFSHLKSQINYFHLPKTLGIQHSNNPVKKFLQDPWKFRNRSETFFPHVNITWDGTRNPMTFDMGWPAERADEEEEASKYISELDADFTLVMILEHLDESIVLLRRLMCWELRDVLLYSKRKNARGYPYKTYKATPKELENHRAWSAVDYMLYNTFNNSLWRKIKEQGPDFYDELKYFKRIKHDVSNFCTRTMEVQNGGNQSMVVTASKWNPEFQVDQKFCWYITRTKAFYMDREIKGRKYTKKEMDYSVMTLIYNYRLLHMGLPSYKSLGEARAAGCRHGRSVLNATLRLQSCISTSTDNNFVTRVVLPTTEPPMKDMTGTWFYELARDITSSNNVSSGWAAPLVAVTADSGPAGSAATDSIITEISVKRLSKKDDTIDNRLPTMTQPPIHNVDRMFKHFEPFGWRSRTVEKLAEHLPTTADPPDLLPTMVGGVRKCS
ncbi:hypothetical protein Bbelb_152720 [Branchiostoma belcheri]|nr:hypothetical protein Bbelb_152720 [Branchiostoma belcheri]